jgi:pimeloyl-ACP methyl ester carboxylesterase
MPHAVAPDGAALAYDLFDFTAPWKPAETVTLHHGGRGNRRFWYREWVPALARRFRTAVMDARERGESAVPAPGFAWSLEQYATDVLSVANAAGAAPFHFVGDSLGAVIGLYLGARYGDRILSLVLISPPYRFDHAPGLIGGWAEGYRQLGAYGFLVQDVRRMFGPEADPAMIEWVAGQMARVPEHVAAELLHFLPTVNLKDLLPAVAPPTLLLAPTRSDRVDLVDVEFIRDQLPRAELVTFDYPHNIALGIPERVIPVVLEFLERHSATA